MHVLFSWCSLFCHPGVKGSHCLIQTGTVPVTSVPGRCWMHSSLCVECFLIEKGEWGFSVHPSLLSGVYKRVIYCAVLGMKREMLTVPSSLYTYPGNHCEYNVSLQFLPVPVPNMLTVPSCIQYPPIGHTSGNVAGWKSLVYGSRVPYGWHIGLAGAGCYVWLILLCYMLSLVHSKSSKCSLINHCPFFFLIKKLLFTFFHCCVLLYLHAADLLQLLAATPCLRAHIPVMATWYFSVWAFLDGDSVISVKSPSVRSSSDSVTTKSTTRRQVQSVVTCCNSRVFMACSSGIILMKNVDLQRSL